MEFIKNTFLDIIGTYEPITYAVTTTDGAIDYVIPSGAAGVDWSWIMSAALYLVIFYCILRAIGGHFSK